MQLERMTFFSDAVFAIAITLLVIEIKVPHVETSDGLARALLGLVPNYVGFIVSFFVIGRFWIGHHRAMGQLVALDSRLVWLNLLLLFTIAFMPFPTAVFSDYTITRAAVALYCGWLMLAGLANVLLIGHGLKSAALLDPEADPAVTAALLRGRWLPLLIGVLALGLGMWRPLYALIPLLGSPLIQWGLRRLFNRAGSATPAG